MTDEQQAREALQELTHTQRQKLLLILEAFVIGDTETWQPIIDAMTVKESQAFYEAVKALSEIKPQRATGHYIHLGGGA